MNQQPDSNPSQARAAAQSNLRYTATLVRDSNDAIIVQDFTGRISTWNHQAELMYGYSEAEALQMTSWCLVPPGKVAGLKEIVRRLMAGEWIASFATQQVAKDGRILDVWLTVTKLVDGDGRPIGIASTARDLTAGKLATDLQLASELRYRRLFETAEDGILILDAVTGLIVDVNPFLIDLLGYSRTVFLGKKLWEVGLFKDIVANRAKFAELQEHEHIRYEDLPLETSDGRQIEVEFVSTVYQVDGKKVIQCNIRDLTLRKRMEAALAGCENKYRDLFQGNRDALMTLEPPTWKLTAGNPAALQMFGAKDEVDFIAHAPWELSPERQPDGRASAEKAQEMFETVLREGSHFFEWTHRRLDGGEFQVNVLLTKMERDGKVVVQATVRDITERKRAEMALREKEYLLSESQRLGHVGSWFYDMQGPMKWSEEMYRLYGVSPDTFIPTVESLLSLIYPDDRPAMQTWLTTCVVGAKHELIFRINRPDGKIRFLLGRGEPFHDPGNQVTHMAGTVLDITEHEQVQAEMRLQSSALCAAANAIVIADQNGNVVWANPAFTKLTGYEVSEILGKNPRILKSGQHDMAFYRQMWETISAGKVWSGELVNKRKDGSLYTEGMTITPVSDEGGAISNFIAIKQDITARKQAGEALHKNALELQSKNSELERFLYTSSHDLKSPVVTVRTFLGYLEQDMATGDADLIAKDMQFIQTATGKMVQELDDLMEFARVGRVVGVPVDVTFRALVDDALGAVAGRIAKRGVTLQVNDCELVLHGDKARLAEVFQNLIDNACKFMGDQKEPRIEIGFAENNGETAFFVRDNGIGIDPRFQSKIFNLFEKVDPKVEGTGMGLALVKRIVELSAGRIWVESPGLGQGACFYFTLPGAMPKESSL